MENFNLNRFVEAQESNNMYNVALQEIKQGYKVSHWIWYIFPQHENLGFSYQSKFFGISCLEEAKAYLLHPVLGKRLKEISEEILKHADKDIEDILESVDALKLKSSMTLFDKAEPDSVFNVVLETFYNGEKDDITLSLLSE